MKRSALKTALGVLIAAIGMSAQTINLTADIPFDFRAGNTVMPAGKYEIHTDGGVVRLRTAAGQPKGMFVLANREESTQRKPAVLVFNQYGNDHFLSTIWGANTTSGLRVPPGRLEKELSNRVRYPVATEIAAKTSAR